MRVRSVSRQTHLPSSGRVLPVIVHHRRLAGAVRPDHGRISPPPGTRRRVLPRPRRNDRDVVEIRSVSALIPWLRGWHGDGVPRAAGEQAKDAVGQRQGHHDEQRPSANSHNSGGAVKWSCRHSPAPHRGWRRPACHARRPRPNHRLDRVGRRELARVDDAYLRHVKRAAVRPSPPTAKTNSL
jgi:hypothetical protein